MSSQFPTQSDAFSRAVRTVLQNLGVDVTLAVIFVVQPLLKADVIDWRLLLVAAGKTALVTAVAWVQRTLEARRASAGGPSV